MTNVKGIEFKIYILCFIGNLVDPSFQNRKYMFSNTFIFFKMLEN